VHHDTYQFYSTGVASADRVMFIRTLDTVGAKGKRILEIVKNEWFANLKSTTLDEVRREGMKPFANPVKDTLFQGLTWNDLVFHPGNVLDTARRLPKSVVDLPTVLKNAFPGPVQMATNVATSIGKGLASAAVKYVVGLFVRDSEWYINRGGYRDEVDADLKPYHDDTLKHKTTPPEALYVITMKTPDGAGDGTVPESSARALKPFAKATVKYDMKGKKIRRTFSIGDKAGVEADFVKKKAPRTRPKLLPDCDEAWFDRGHEPIYKSKSAQHITFTAIENICRRRIAEQVKR
jgi:hypothetical protein